MTDLDPKIWDNPTLGAASNLPFLDDVQNQIIENVDAKREDRTPERISRRPRFSNETTNVNLTIIEGENGSEIVPDNDPDAISLNEYNSAQEPHRIHRAQKSSESLQEGKETKDKIPVIPDTPGLKAEKEAAEKKEAADNKRAAEETEDSASKATEVPAQAESKDNKDLSKAPTISRTSAKK